MWRKPLLRILSLAATLLALGGCAGVGFLPDFGGGASSEDRTPREPPTALHPGLIDCRPQGAGGSMDLPAADLNAASWSVPSGFYDVSDSYYEENPVEDLQWQWVGASRALPGGTLDLVTVNHYTGISWKQNATDCNSVPLEAIEEKLAQYRTHIGATALNEAKVIRVNGYPAISQDLRLANYDYEGYWLFSTTDLLHVYCQWERSSSEAEIRRGCKELINSVVVPL